MIKRLPDGIVTVHLNDEQYRGAYYYRGDELVVTAYGLQESSVDMAVLDGERGNAAHNLAESSDAVSVLTVLDWTQVAIVFHNAHCQCVAWNN